MLLLRSQMISNDFGLHTSTKVSNEFGSFTGNLQEEQRKPFLIQKPKMWLLSAANHSNAAAVFVVPAGLQHSRTRSGRDGR